MTVPSCHPDRPVYSFGLCESCYKKDYKQRCTKRFEMPVLLARIEELVDCSGGDSACHTWRGTIERTQPLLWHVYKNFHPRRVLFEARYGKLNPPARVHMKCGNTSCLNTEHMMGGFEMYFHKQVDRSGGPNACWPWTGMLTKGYGRFGTRHRVRYLAHRVAYELAHGMIKGHVPHTDKELVVMHTCDNPRCCNPAHLRLGTDADNIADKVAKGRQARGDKLRQAMQKRKQLHQQGDEE